MATTTTTATTSYAGQTAWRKQMACLPPALQWAEQDNLGASVGLQEATFEWKGHAVHVDRFDVPDSPAQLILLHGTVILGWRRSIFVECQYRIIEAEL